MENKTFLLYIITTEELLQTTLRRETSAFHYIGVLLLKKTKYHPDQQHYLVFELISSFKGTKRETKIARIIC